MAIIVLIYFNDGEVVLCRYQDFIFVEADRHQINAPSVVKQLEIEFIVSLPNVV